MDEIEKEAREIEAIEKKQTEIDSQIKSINKRINELEKE